MNIPMNSVLRLYQSFDLRVCCRDTDKSLSLRLRHRVYADELGYEARQHNGKAVDAWDEDAVALNLVWKPLDLVVGTVRLVPERPLFPQLPMVRTNATCDVAWGTGLGEISRLAVSRPVRTQATLPSLGIERPEIVKAWANDRELFPLVAPILMVGAILVGHQMGFRWAVGIGEQSLLDFARHLGVSMTVMGPPVEHRGLRIPFRTLCDPAQHEGGVAQLAELLNESISKSLSA